jgi:hypothetical protein
MARLPKRVPAKPARAATGANRAPTKWAGMGGNVKGAKPVKRANRAQSDLATLGGTGKPATKAKPATVSRRAPH